MDDSDLLSLDAQERTVILRQSAQLRAVGQLTDASEFFPEFDQDVSRAYGRGPLPLAALALLYDEVVVYVPPLPIEQLQTRLGVSWDDFAELVDSGLVRPIVGHLTDYAPELHDLISSRSQSGDRPPSVWARGLALLEALDIQDVLDESACPLPVAIMAQDPRLRSVYSELFPVLSPAELDARIRQEILTNYADLCVVGEGAIAERWATWPDPSLILSTLMFTAEMIAYPILFGGGGTANYDLGRLQDLGWIDSRLTKAINDESARVFPTPELDRLFRGIDLNIETLTGPQVLELHRSGDLGRLREGIRAFEDVADRMARLSLDQRSDEISIVEERAATLTDLLSEAARDLASLQQQKEVLAWQKRTASIVRGGALALGALSGALVTRTPLGTLAPPALLSMVMGPIEDRAVEAAYLRRFKPGLASLWQFRLRDLD